ncbi:MAG: hypothetical protein PHW96_00865 [Candidatus Nanoarchaeia archaeon]|nr:hypothetical protein [Candidatus Nanoarchaeia archaeon]
MDLIVKSKVKEYLKKKGKRTSLEAIEALNREVLLLCDKAAKRAKDVGTIKERHV